MEMKTEPIDGSTWGALPPAFISPFTVAEFGTQTMKLGSLLFLLLPTSLLSDINYKVSIGKGTYGVVSYTTRMNHTITLSWANPFVGKNMHTAKVSATSEEDATMLVIEGSDKKASGSNLFEVDINLSLADNVDPAMVDHIR